MLCVVMYMFNSTDRLQRHGDAAVPAQLVHTDTPTDTNMNNLKKKKKHCAQHQLDG